MLKNEKQTLVMCWCFSAVQFIHVVDYSSSHISNLTASPMYLFYMQLYLTLAPSSISVLYVWFGDLSDMNDDFFFSIQGLHHPSESRAQRADSIDLQHCIQQPQLLWVCWAFQQSRDWGVYLTHNSFSLYNFIIFTWKKIVKQKLTSLLMWCVLNSKTALCVQNNQFTEDLAQ